MNRLFILLGVVVLWFSPGIASGATALLVGGTGKYAELTDEQMKTAFGGYFADYDRVNVPFPGDAMAFGYSVEVGAKNLYDAVYATAGPKTIGGVSEGAPAVQEVLRRLMNDPNRPAPSELNAAIYGSPSRIFYGGVPYRPLPETPYNVVVVTAEYDGIADWPGNPFNLLAVVNAVMGASQLHVDRAFYDISTVPAEYKTVTTNSKGGTTTTVLIPTAVLPLLEPYVAAGFAPEFIDFLDSLLRPIIDSAYNRPPPQAKASVSTSAPQELADPQARMVAAATNLPPETAPAPAVFAGSGVEHVAPNHTQRAEPPAGALTTDFTDRHTPAGPAVGGADETEADTETSEGADSESVVREDEPELQQEPTTPNEPEAGPSNAPEREADSQPDNVGAGDDSAGADSSNDDDE